VTRSVLGRGVVVAAGVAVVDSVVLGDSVVEADIERVIVDEAAHVVEETTGADEPAVIA
jgi:ADP-glucose pyrophosphorylase